MPQDRKEFKVHKEKSDRRDQQAHKDRKVRRAFKEKLDQQDHKDLLDLTDPWDQ